MSSGGRKLGLEDRVNGLQVERKEERRPRWKRLPREVKNQKQQVIRDFIAEG